MREITVIVPFYNGHKYIHNLIDTIPDNINTIIVDDLSDEKLNLNKENVTVCRLQEKKYFAGAVNFGIQQCTTDVLILNQDSLLSDGWQEVIEENRDEYAMIGEAIKGVHPLFPFQYIHGTYLFITRELINDIGILNTELYPLWGNTAEYQLRASRAGYKVLPLKEVKGFTHLRGNKPYGDSIKASITQENKSKLINTPPEISIIIPCHNYAKYLPDAIGSLIGGKTCLGNLPPQTFQSFEIIIVDDGSNEENQKQINSFVDGWNGIRVIRLDRKPLDNQKKYIGKPTALNAGIEKAIGKFITVLDCDDMMDSRRLETLYNLAVQNPNKIIYDQILSFKQNIAKTKWRSERSDKGIVLVDTSQLSLGEETIKVSKTACENFRKTAIGDRLSFYYWPLPDYNFDELLYKNCMHAGILFPKSAWQEIGGYNPQMKYGREDWAINIAFGEKGYCGLKTNQPFYLYRREGQNRTLENTKPHWQKRFTDQLQEIYRNLYRGERTMACCGRGSKPTQLNKNLNVKSLSQDGITQLVYVGARVTPFTVWGVDSGASYRINPKNPVFRALNEDLASQGRKTGLLDMYEGTKYMFEVYKPKVEKPQEKIEVVEIKPLVDSALSENETELTSKDLIRFDLISSIFDMDLVNAKNTIYENNLTEYELVELQLQANEKKASKLLLNFINVVISEFAGKEAQEEIDIKKGILDDRHFDALATLTSLRHFLLTDTYSLEELNLMLAYESSDDGKQRKTAIEMLELNIDQYDGSHLFNTGDVQD